MAYSFVKRGSSGSDYDKVAKEVDDRIFFAGEVGLLTCSLGNSHLNVLIIVPYYRDQIVIFHRQSLVRISAAFEKHQKLHARTETEREGMDDFDDL